MLAAAAVADVGGSRSGAAGDDVERAGGCEGGALRPATSSILTLKISFFLGSPREPEASRLPSSAQPNAVHRAHTLSSNRPACCLPAMVPVSQLSTAARPVPSPRPACALPRVPCPHPRLVAHLITRASSHAAAPAAHHYPIP
jgi:hypothetical protein